MSSPWTDEEIAKLRRAAVGRQRGWMPRVAAELGRSVRAVRCKVHKLGIGTYRRYGPRENAVASQYRVVPARILAKRLGGRSASSVANRARRLGVSGEHRRPPAWTPKQDALLRELIERAAVAYGRSPSSVASRAFHLVVGKGKHRALPVKATGEEVPRPGGSGPA